MIIKLWLSKFQFHWTNVINLLLYKMQLCCYWYQQRKSTLASIYQTFSDFTLVDVWSWFWLLITSFILGNKQLASLCNLLESWSSVYLMSPNLWPCLFLSLHFVNCIRTELSLCDWQVVEMLTGAKFEGISTVCGAGLSSQNFVFKSLSITPDHYLQLFNIFITPDF